MNLDIIIMIQIFLISYTITRFEPLQMVLDELPDNLVMNVIKLLLSCSKCVSFWTGLIIGNIWMAMIVSLFMVIFEKTFGHWESKIKIN
jgi:hypothetical protein